MLTLTINGQQHDLDGVDPATPLLWVLRDHLDLVGAKYGCGIGQCGACTVHLDGVPTKSCSMPVGSIGTKAITTIEGLAQDGKLHPLQQAWIEHDVAQCGYCQAGQMMSAAALLAKNPKPNDKDIDTAMNGNLCRCGTYSRIREAVRLASSLGGSR